MIPAQSSSAWRPSLPADLTEAEAICGCRGIALHSSAKRGYVDLRVHIPCPRGHPTIVGAGVIEHFPAAQVRPVPKPARLGPGQTYQQDALEIEEMAA